LGFWDYGVLNKFFAVFFADFVKRFQLLRPHEKVMQVMAVLDKEKYR
jgi:hypothetical protein